MTFEIRFPYTGNDQFLLFNIEQSKLNDLEVLRNQRLKNHTFILKTKGSGVFTIDGVAYRTSCDESMILHAPKRSIMTIGCKESLEYYELLYHVRPNPAHLVEAFIFVLKPDNTLPLFEMTDQLLKDFHIQKADSFHIASLFYKFIDSIWKELQTLEESKSVFDIADQVIEWIEHRYKEQITLEKLSAVFQYSTKHLSRIVKKQTGMSPIQYLIYVRMEKAKAMLKHTDAKLNEIAKNSGYNDLFYFSSQFKKNTGIAPGKYRQHYIQSQELLNKKSRNHMSITINSPYNLIENNYQLGKDLLLMIKKFGFKSYLIGLLCFVLILQACGNEDADGTDAKKLSGEEVDEEEMIGENTGFPRTLEDDAGNEIVLEEQPERIAVTHFAWIDYLLALGITPIAGAYLDTPKTHTSFESYQEELASIEEIGQTDAINIEKLVELDPDLIIDFVGSENIDQLSQVAPTGSVSFNEVWQDKLRLLAELTGKEEEAEDLIEGLEAEIAETRDSLDYDPEDTVVIMVGGDWWISGEETTTHIFNEAKGLGLKAPENNPEQMEQMSLEGLVDMNPDYFLILADSEEVYEEVVKQLNNSDAWQTTNAAQKEQIFYMNRAAQNESPLAIQYMLQRMKEIFGEK